MEVRGDGAREPGCEGARGRGAEGAMQCEGGMGCGGEGSRVRGVEGARGGEGENATTSPEAILTQGRYSCACSPPLLPVSGLVMGSYGDR